MKAVDPKRYPRQNHKSHSLLGECILVNMKSKTCSRLIRPNSETWIAMSTSSMFQTTILLIATKLSSGWQQWSKCKRDAYFIPKPSTIWFVCMHREGGLPILLWGEQKRTEAKLKGTRPLKRVLRKLLVLSNPVDTHAFRPRKRNYPTSRRLLLAQCFYSRTVIQHTYRAWFHSTSER